MTIKDDKNIIQQVELVKISFVKLGVLQNEPSKLKEMLKIRQRLLTLTFSLAIMAYQSMIYII